MDSIAAAIISARLAWLANFAGICAASCLLGGYRPLVGRDNELLDSSTNAGGEANHRAIDFEV